MVFITLHLFNEKVFMKFGFSHCFWVKRVFCTNEYELWMGYLWSSWFLGLKLYPFLVTLWPVCNKYITETFFEIEDFYFHVDKKLVLPFCDLLYLIQSVKYSDTECFRNAHIFPLKKSKRPKTKKSKKTHKNPKSLQVLMTSDGFE